jgi:hypothetical protein
MLLVAMMVLTNTVSADGSIGGVYQAGLQLAGQTGTRTQKLVGGGDQKPPTPPAKQETEQKDQSKTGLKPEDGGQNKQ